MVNKNDAEVIAAWLKRYEEGDWEAKKNALSAIGNLALNSDISGIDIEPLINALNDEDYGVRFTAANVLGKLGDIRAIPHLIKALKEDDDKGVRRYAVISLGNLFCNNKGNVDNGLKGAIIIALKDVDSGVRRAAVVALGDMLFYGDDELIIRKIKTMIYDKNASVRKAASIAFGKVPKVEFIYLLINALKDDNDNVVDEALKSLEASTKVINREYKFKIYSALINFIEEKDNDDQDNLVKQAKNCLKHISGFTYEEYLLKKERI